MLIFCSGRLTFGQQYIVRQLTIVWWRYYTYCAHILLCSHPNALHTLRVHLKFHALKLFLLRHLTNGSVLLIAVFPCWTSEWEFFLLRCCYRFLLSCLGLIAQMSPKIAMYPFKCVCHYFHSSQFCINWKVDFYFIIMLLFQFKMI